MDFSEMAQDFVEAVSVCTEDKTINIMNREGKIIASTDKSRIGTIHEGAIEVIKTGSPLFIKTEDLNSYTGAKEGFNMPINYEGKIIGVVGLRGSDKSKKDLADLLCIYVSQFFKLKKLEQKEKTISEIRSRMIELMIFGSKKDIDNIYRLSDAASIQIRFPLRVYVFRLKEDLKEENIVSPMSNAVQFIEKLDYIKYKDVYGYIDNSFIIIHFVTNRHEDRFKEDLKDFVEKNQEYKIAISNKCYKINEIQDGYEEAKMLTYLSDAQILDMSESDNVVKYYIYKAYANGGYKYVERSFKKLYLKEDPKNIDIFLRSAEVYFDEDRSIKRASEKLFVHKNTLTYRLNRLYECLEIEDNCSFNKEFLIRMMILSKNKYKASCIL